MSVLHTAMGSGIVEAPPLLIRAMETFQSDGDKLWTGNVNPVSVLLQAASQLPEGQRNVSTEKLLVRVILDKFKLLLENCPVVLEPDDHVLDTAAVRSWFCPSKIEACPARIKAC